MLTDSLSTRDTVSAPAQECRKTLTISVIVPARNEAQSIERTLAQLVSQDYAPERFEILVIDGQSTDGTSDLVAGFVARHRNVRLFANPKCLSSAARNIGIRESRSDVLLIVDGHCELDSQYLSRLASAFQRSGADCIGRPQPLDVPGASTLQRAIAAARSSWLGHHPGSRVYSCKEGLVPAESVAVAYRCSVFERVGTFDERFDACEDVEMNHRIDRAGLRCFFAPEVAVHYAPRATLGGLFRQLFRYGRGRVRLWRKHPETFSFGILPPPMLVAGLIVGLPLSFAASWLAEVYLAAAVLYSAVVLAGSASIALRLRSPRLLGHRFRTRCDTEAIVHAYEEWGTECVSHLRGMFAFIIWDTGRQQLFAARDRLGVKPFYYLSAEGILLCASEVKALIASGWYRPELNMEAIPEFLTFGYLAGDATLFRDVRKLLPGHWLIWKNGDLRINRYWEIPLPAGHDGLKTERAIVEEFLELFEESVRLRLMSDVPLGVFLSGGLDSSAIAATMARQISDPVKTFSVGFEADYYSEFDFAREVAAAIGADHHEVVLKPDDAFASLPRLIWHEDEPVRNASSVALYEVSRLAGEHVKVVLTGEGSDELFAGYERYWATLFNLKWGRLYHRLVPGWFHRPCVARTLWHWPLPLSLKKKLSHTFLNHALCPEEIVFDNFYAVFPRRLHEQLFAAETWDRLRSCQPYAETLQYYSSRGGNGDLLDQLLYTDQKTYLVELLMKQDNMSMAALIESRVPFLDHKLVEFAARVPAEFKLRGFTGKYLVKQAMRKLLPRSILDRKKMGFPVPLRDWFQRGFDRVVRRIALSGRARGRGILNPPFVEQMLAEHARGTRDHTDALWTVLNFELWLRIFIDQEGWASVGEDMAAVR